MRFSSKLIRVGAIAGTLVPLLVVAAAASKPVRVSSTVTLSNLGPQGRVFSPKPFCVNQRNVSLKYTDANGAVRVFGSDRADASGQWSTDGDGTGLHGLPPWKIYAVVNRHRVVKHGKLYICEPDRSPSQTISGN
jgi:hypothetical protein